MVIPVTEAMRRKAREVGQAPWWGERGSFDGTPEQKGLGHLAMLATLTFLGLGEDALLPPGQDSPDQGDIAAPAGIVDVKGSFCRTFRASRVPPSWGLIVPESQALREIHDFYIRVILDGQAPEEIRFALVLGGCRGAEVARSLPQIDNPETGKPFPAPMRVVPFRCLSTGDALRRMILERKEEPWP